MKNAFLMWLLLSFAPVCLAAEQLLASADNQVDRVVTKLYLILGENQDAQELKVDYILDGEVINTSLFRHEMLKEGIVLDEREGKEIIKLYSDNFSSHQGGEIVLSYLYNGLTGARRFVLLDLARDSDQWTIYFKNRSVRKLSFIARKLWGRIIGVQRVDFVYKDSVTFSPARYPAPFVIE